MTLNVGGYEQKPDWPKMGPSLLIAASLILAIRTARWPTRHSTYTMSERDLDAEVENAIHLAGRVLAVLVSRKPSIFHQKQSAWYVPDDDDVAK